MPLTANDDMSLLANANKVIGMTAARTVLAELEDRGVAFDVSEPDHARRFLNLDHTAGEFLHFIVRATRRRRILEIGTSNGCSTIWLAMALSELASDGRLITIERLADKQKAAVENVRRAGLEGFVQFLLGDATEIVQVVDGAIDCVFFDADRVTAYRQLNALLPKLALDCLLITDNALSHPHELCDYFDLLSAHPDFQTITLPIGKGLHVAHRQSAGYA
jgi:predicted O-methyltransferase YrrM